jgi:hypothetical protein
MKPLVEKQSIKPENHVLIQPIREGTVGDRIIQCNKPEKKIVGMQCSQMQPSSEENVAILQSREGIVTMQPTREGIVTMQPTREGIVATQPTREGIVTMQPTREGIVTM